MDTTETYYIYKICCDDIDEFYIGSTQSVRHRKSRHKGVCNIETRKGHNAKNYQTIRANGGWDNWRMVVIEEMPNTTKIGARIREEFYRVELKATLNTRSAYNHLTPQEYKKKYDQAHSEEKKEYNKEYNVTHKEERAEYYQKNKEYIDERQKKYRATHIEKVKEYQKEYRATHNKEYRATHCEEMNKKQREYRATHREEINRKQREYKARKKAEKLSAI